MSKGSDLYSVIAAIAQNAVRNAHGEQNHIAKDGMIVHGSWNPTEGTVDVLVQSSMAINTDATEQPVILYGIQLLTPISGQQGGPTGDERCLLIPRESGWAAILEHGDDDSPKAPAGEHWHVHSTTGSYVKLQNNGTTSLHGSSQIAGTAPTIALTASSTATVSATGSATLSGATATVSATGAATITGSSVSLGPTGGTHYSIIRTQDLVALVAYIASHTHSGVSSGGSNTGAPTSAPPTVTGSPNVTCA